MSKKIFLEALSMAWVGRLQEAVELVRQLDIGFMRKRLAHYKNQPDHREAALQLEAALDMHGRAKATAAPVPQTVRFEAPLSPAVVEAPPEEAIGFDNPEPFLRWVSADRSRSPPLDLDRLRYTDLWALVALGSLGLHERERRPPLQTSGQSTAARFAHALGLDALSGGAVPTYDEPHRTVRLTRVRSLAEIEPTAGKMAALVVRGEGSYDVRRAVQYVLVELLRNVLQHSQDPLGAVAAAQRMGPQQRRPRPMIQIAVADAGIGIPRSLHRAHPHLADYRQALERALLPHISGTFEEGLTGSFENAGLGLYMISEMARQTGGRLLIATTGAALVVQGSSDDTPANPRFLQPAGTGFPGTLVSFEIPSDAAQDHHALMQAILRKAGERTPKRAADRWLSFDPAPRGAERIVLLDAHENTVAASEIARERIRPALLQRQPIELDFEGLDLCTQSWLHALLFEPVRLAWALRVPIHIVHADPAVREGLRFLEAYALGG
jgi:anti-sigma regulatory factor (Ser/Thr protein kinase)